MAAAARSPKAQSSPRLRPLALHAFYLQLVPNHSSLSPPSSIFDLAPRDALPCPCRLAPRDAGAPPTRCPARKAALEHFPQSVITSPSQLHFSSRRRRALPPSLSLAVAATARRMEPGSILRMEDVLHRSFVHPVVVYSRSVIADTNDSPAREKQHDSEVRIGKNKNVHPSVISSEEHMDQTKVKHKSYGSPFTHSYFSYGVCSLTK